MRPVGDLDLELDTRQVERTCLPVHQSRVKWFLALPPWPEVASLHLDLAELGWHGREHVTQISYERPPEFIRVVMDHPVGAMSQPGDLGHMRDAIALVMALLLVANDLGDAHALVLSKDLAGAILRSVVGDNHEIDALGQVILEVGLDH